MRVPRRRPLRVEVAAFIRLLTAGALCKAENRDAGGLTSFTRLLQSASPVMPAHLYGPFRKRLDAFTYELEGIEAGNVEAVHHARVASRRLRELLPLLELDRDVTRNLSRRLRKVTNQLGAVREADVLMLLMQEISKDSRYPEMAVKQIGGTAARAGAVARERLSTKLPTAKLKRLARKLERVSKGLDSNEAGTDRRGASSPRSVRLWALEAQLTRRASRVREAVEAAGAVYVPEPLHGVRIAVKKLRYVAELAAGSTRKRIAADIAALKAVQDLLGRLHDFEMLLVRAREAQASVSPPDLAAWRDLGSVIHIVQDECRRLHARYMHDRSGLRAIAHRMGTSAREAQPVGRRTAS